MTNDWQTPFQTRLARLALATYRGQVSAHLRSGRVRSTFRYCPPQWHRDAVAAMGLNDEEAAKAAVLYRVTS